MTACFCSPQCPGGYYSETGHEPNCRECPAGFISKQGSKLCTECLSSQTSTPGSEILTATGFVLDFGTIVNNGNLNDGNEETIAILYTVLIGNDGSNTLMNNANWNWGGQSINDEEIVNVVEAEIAFNKELTGLSNDFVSVELTIENTGVNGVAAYAIEVEDIYRIHIIYIKNSIV